MAKIAFFWVRDDLTGVRGRELEQSRVRSHAAKIAHRRKKHSTAHHDRPDVRCTPSSLPLAVPTPAFYKGNSDPFRVTVVEITPRVVQAFQFLKDALVPSTHFNTSGTGGSWSRRFLPDQTVRKHMQSMNDEWSALAEMLPLSAALTRLSKSNELITQTLQLKNKAIRRVHSKLQSLDTIATADHIIRLTRTLFASSTFENNMTEARMHGVALKKLLYRKTKQEGLEAVDVNLMWSTLYYDAQVAQTTMSPSIFDVDNWARKRLELATKPLTRLLEGLHPHVAQDLDPILGHSRILQEICVDIYSVTWLWHQYKPLSSEIDGPMMNLYATTRHNIFQIRLSNHYVRLRRHLLEASARTRIPAKRTFPTEDMPLDIEAVLTIALIAYLASFVGNSRIGGQYMWPRITLFLSQLHRHLSMIDRFSECLQADDASYDRVLLFAYWVGATWEHIDELVDSDVPQLWFTRGFINVLQRMHLHTWRDIKPILDRFVPSELARPSGLTWVDATVRPDLPQSQGEAVKSAAGWTTVTHWYMVWKAQQLHPVDLQDRPEMWTG